MLSSEDWAEAHAKEVLATIIAQAQVADDFAYLARTPANAAKLALDKAGLQPGDIDLWEINEAFASVTLNSIRMLGIDEDRVNVNGGAVAIGHPIGASGARIIATLVHELRRRGGGYGCAAICSGGGQGDAVIIRCDEAPPAASASRGRRRAPPRRAGRGLLRPRPHVDGGLVGVPVRPRRLPRRASSTAACWPATRGRTSSSACAARPTPAPTRCGARSASC